MSDSASIIPSMPCPFCGYVMDRSTCASESGAHPKNGDISICIECGELGEFVGGEGTVSAMKRLDPGKQFDVLMEFPQVARVCKEIKNGRSSRKS